LRQTDKKQLILVETTEDMASADIPEQLLPESGLGPWVISITETQSVQVQSMESFQAKLLSFLAQGGRTKVVVGQMSVLLPFSHLPGTHCV